MKKAIFTGCTEDQKQFGNHDGDISKLEVGKQYNIVNEEIHSWHTKVFIENMNGSFNSVCFEILDDNGTPIPKEVWNDESKRGKV